MNSVMCQCCFPGTRDSSGGAHYWDGDSCTARFSCSTMSTADVADPMGSVRLGLARPGSAPALGTARS